MRSIGPTHLSRRERQIMDSLYRRGQATVLDIQADLPDAPTDSAIRAMLRLLEAKRQVSRQSETRPHIYRPRTNKDEAGRGAVQHLLQTFFGGSKERAIQAILSTSDTQLDAHGLARLEALIRDARRAEKKNGR